MSINLHNYAKKNGIEYFGASQIAISASVVALLQSKLADCPTLAMPNRRTSVKPANLLIILISLAIKFFIDVYIFVFTSYHILFAIYSYEHVKWLSF